jgi:hypothetical protein
MLYSIGIIILTVFILVLIKYLQYKFHIKFFKIFLIIISLSILFYGYFEISSIIYSIRIENEFNEKIQLYDKGHGDYGLLKKYESLTEEERKIYDSYIGDGGRNLFMLMINPTLFLINIGLIIILHFIIDGLIYLWKFYTKNKNEKLFP